MKFTIFSTIVTLIYCVNTALAISSTRTSCTPYLGSPSDGFQANFYKYLYPDYAAESNDEYYISKGYKKPERYLATVSGITNINFYHFYNFNTNGPTWGLINDYNITISNFTVEYTGWFVPKESGDYIFQIGQTDDGSRIEIYENSAYQCCDTTVNSTVIQNIQYYDETHVSTATINMEAGIPYPIKIVYFNKDSVAIQTIQFTDPTGIVHSTFDGYVVYYSGASCPDNQISDESLPLTSLVSDDTSSGMISSNVASSSITSTYNSFHSSIPSSTTTTTPISTSLSMSTSPVSSFTIEYSVIKSSSSSDPVVSKSTILSETLSSSSERFTSSISMSFTTFISSATSTPSISAVPDIIAVDMDMLSPTTDSIKSLPVSFITTNLNASHVISSQTNTIEIFTAVLYSKSGFEEHQSIIGTPFTNSESETLHIASSSILAHVVTSSVNPVPVPSAYMSISSTPDIVISNSSSKESFSTDISNPSTIESHSGISFNKTEVITSEQTYSSILTNSLVLSRTVTFSNMTRVATSVIETNEGDRSTVTLNGHLGTVSITATTLGKKNTYSNTLETSECTTAITSCSSNTRPNPTTNQIINLVESRSANTVTSTVSSDASIQKADKTVGQSGVEDHRTQSISVIAIQSTSSEVAKPRPSGIQVNINGGVSVKENNIFTYLVLLTLTALF